MSASKTISGSTRVLRSTTKKSYVEEALDEKVDTEENPDPMEPDVEMTDTKALIGIKRKGSTDFSPKLPGTVKRSKQSKNSAMDEEEACVVQMLVAKEKKETKKQQEKKAKEDPKMLPLKQMNDARIKRESRTIRERTAVLDKMAWKEGQKNHLFDLPTEILEMWVCPFVEPRIGQIEPFFQDRLFDFDQDLSAKDFCCIAASCWFLRFPFLQDEVWRSIYTKKIAKTVQPDRHTMYTDGFSSSRSRGHDQFNSVRPNLSGQHCPVSKSTACYLLDKMRAKDKPSKVLRFGVTDTEKPVSKPDHERTQAMLQRFNNYSQSRHYEFACPGEGDTPARARKKAEGLEIAKWVPERLPLSRSEAMSMGCRATYIPLAQGFSGTMGPGRPKSLDMSTSLWYLRHRHTMTIG